MVCRQGGLVVALLALAAVLAGCQRSRPVIYLDDGWNALYVKNTCYLYLPKGNRDPGLDACLERQLKAQQDFAQALRAQLRIQPACAAVLIANPDAGREAPTGGGFWRLLINQDDLEGRREKWDLMRPQRAGIVHGAGDAATIARDVCTTAGAAGGSWWHRWIHR